VDGVKTIDSAHVKGEPGTGYEGPAGGPFECANCEYFNGHSCGQEDMMQRSKLTRDAENRPITDPHGCCEYVDRKEKDMAKLDTAERKSIPSGEFGLPGSRKYPMPNRSHAANAKARATQMVKRGKLSSASAAKIRAKADRILGEK
jgi:hypothetical protein